MIIKAPETADLPQLQKLWEEAFGDGEDFWRSFLQKGKADKRCRSAWEEGCLAGALYWFDCSWDGKPVAYLYGVATAKAFQGRGVCRALMEDAHEFLRDQGYHGCVLVPGSEELLRMYEKMGYTICSQIREFSCAAGAPVALRQLDGEGYARLRRQYLPEKGVVQEKETLDLLAVQGWFYAGENCLLVCSCEKEKLVVSELLGDVAAAGGVLGALGYGEGSFRVPGEGRPFAMYHPLVQDTDVPAYFGLAMD